MNKNVPYYPCIKYKIPASPKLDGSNYLSIAESMHIGGLELRVQKFKVVVEKSEFFESKLQADDEGLLQCNLSFTCANDELVFYKILKDCLLGCIANQES